MPDEEGAIAIPVPPPPLPTFCPPPPSLVKSKFFKKVAESSHPSVGGCEELKKLIKKLLDRFSGTLKWIPYYQHIPSLIQEGPQCGLVALWMAGRLLDITHEVTLDTTVQIARSRGYTTLGEMFSADNMACLAEEVFGCHCELLAGGMEGDNRERILHHLTEGLPVLIPFHPLDWSGSARLALHTVLSAEVQKGPSGYDEDFNHEPCQRDGHRAHWAVISGVLFGTETSSSYEDPEVPGLYYPPASPPSLHSGDTEQTYLIAKQGKSLRYQLWEYGSVSRSNGQLNSLDPKRASDGNAYVIPEGGVGGGLCGKTLLLKPSDNRKHERSIVST